MSSIDKLAELFGKLPGIGPRQAKRFVYYLLSHNGNYSGELMQAVQELKREITQCGRCMRFFHRQTKSSVREELCNICSDDTRDRSMLMVVPRDVDLDAVEKSGSYRGYYFVLGGVVPILEKEPEKRVRIKNLKSRIKNSPEIQEVILAMNANQEGESTAEYLKDRIKNHESGIAITNLGRGLSTGVELEYSDPETLRNAFMHRTK